LGEMRFPMSISLAAVVCRYAIHWTLSDNAGLTHTRIDMYYGDYLVGWRLPDSVAR
jgi:hypothetical protein